MAHSSRSLWRVPVKPKSIISALIALGVTVCFIASVFAGGGAPPSKGTSDSSQWKEFAPIAEQFLGQLQQKQYQAAYQTASASLRDSQSLKDFQREMEAAGFERVQIKSVKWTSGAKTEGGYCINGSMTLSATALSKPKMGETDNRDQRSKEHTKEHKVTFYVILTQDEAPKAVTVKVNLDKAKTETETETKTSANDKTGAEDEISTEVKTEVKPETVQVKEADSKSTEATKVAWRVHKVQSTHWVSFVPTAEAFLKLLGENKVETAYKSGAQLLRDTRTLKVFEHDLNEAGWHQIDPETVRWSNGVAAKDGYRLTGTVKLKEEKGIEAREVPFYLNLLGNEHLSASKRSQQTSVREKTLNQNRKVGTPPIKLVPKIDSWRVLDIQSTESLMSRFSRGAFTKLDTFVFLILFGMLVALVYMILRYVNGLKGSPRELYLMFFTKLTEYSAYGAASYTFVLYLSRDIGLGDSGAAAYYTVFSLTMTITVMVVGAVCDTIGVKKTLLIGTVMLLTARLFMPLTTDIVFTTLLGFLPFALGVAITGPVLKVGIKKFTTTESAALGFGLFYTLMNIGFAIGGWLFDAIRNTYGDGGSVVIPGIGLELSTYQVILGIGFFINIPDLIAVLWMREGVEMTDEGIKFTAKEVVDEAELQKTLSATMLSRLSKIRSEFVIGVMCISFIGYIITTKLGDYFLMSITAALFLSTFAVYWRLKFINAQRAETTLDEIDQQRSIQARYLGLMLSVICILALSALFLHPSVKLTKWGWAAIVFSALITSGLTLYAILSMISLYTGGSFERVMHAVREATDQTVAQLKENFSERPFWIYLFMLSILVFVRLTFFIFHVMFPTYGIRVFGEGAQVGSIFGVLNPILIVFFVPLISILTAKISSYTMLLIGTAISAGAVFLCFIPESIAESLSHGILGDLIYDYWLGVAVGQRDPFYVSIVIFIFFFTIGEAIWSPRLMQFSAEIAPKGKEGAYIALAVLPYFVGKALAGGMSGFLLTSYTPDGFLSFPDHKIVWLWIGGMAMISPIGLVVFRGLFTRVEENSLSASSHKIAENKILEEKTDENTGSSD